MGLLYCLLKVFNLGPEFINWFKTFYKNVSSYLLNNGFFSESFWFKRGVRQGHLLSPYLLLTAAEIPAIAIRSDSNIRNIKVGEDETNVLAYADDMTATLSAIPAVERLFSVLNAFERYSGMKMNLKKKKAMWIGLTRDFQQNRYILHLDWVTRVKNLGIHVSCRKKRLRLKN